MARTIRAAKSSRKVSLPQAGCCTKPSDLKSAGKRASRHPRRSRAGLPAQTAVPSRRRPLSLGGGPTLFLHSRGCQFQFYVTNFQSLTQGEAQELEQVDYALRRRSATDSTC